MIWLAALALILAWSAFLVFAVTPVLDFHHPDED